ncbi:ABC transporter ATP-binding protein [Streptomyces tagetis]|uniref:ABC transporter ATP-binding protein n=1 Tax=Streptomyces tagetis TaxID=2820809 RepID=A0A940XFC9_9ACTN|nr:ATP-binding cassette domain-containing protein [Streptomyces sp. RG38]MBQ0827400.1 ABC transporter ATP-binding protein [Streptomyces sp. RG38]
MKNREWAEAKDEEPVPDDPASAPAPVAEVRDLRVEVGGTVLVDGVNLTARPGRVTALVGTSGSGKTTTGLALLGTYPPGARVSGEVRIAADGPVGYVPQHPASVLNPARRVSALLTDIARLRLGRLPRARRRAAVAREVRRALAEAQLPDADTVLRRFPHQLSGGQQQRVVLAQALLLGARVVVADEPTTGQDALTKARVTERLAALAARGIAVVLLSHDLDVVRALADDLVVLREGRVVESGPAHRLWSAPRHPWTRALLADRAASDAPDPAPKTGPAALRVRGLTARHRDGGRGTAEVLRVPELDLRAGECLAVLGRSGSGKTTLGRCLAGLHRDHSGQILLDGVPLPRSLRDRDRSALAAVQYVFQDARAAFDEHRPVLGQVARTAVRLRGVPADTAAREALDTLTGLGLAETLAHRRPGQLSGGELQRAALARALLARPRVLVCDEITSGLDPVTRRGILGVLSTLLRERDDLALVLITHDLESLAPAHRIAVLDAGEVVEEGPAERVLRAPRHPFTSALLRTRDRLGAPSGS